MRLIEANDVLIEKERRPEDRTVLEEARQLANQRLHQILGDSDPAITAQIMAASDKGPRTIKELMLN